MAEQKHIDDELKEAEMRLMAALRFDREQNSKESAAEAKAAKENLERLQADKRLLEEQTKTAQTQEDTAQETKKAAAEQEEAAEEQERAAKKAYPTSHKDWKETRWGRAMRWGGRGVRDKSKLAAAGTLGGAKQTAKETFSPTNVLPFFIVCVVVYLFEFGTSFNSSVATRLFLYQLLAVWASLGVFRSGEAMNIRAIASSIGFYMMFLFFNFVPNNFVSSTIGPAFAVLSPFVIGILFRSFPFLISGVIFIGPMIKGLLLQTGLPVPDVFGFGLDTVNMVIIGPLWIYYILFFVPKEELPPVAKYLTRTIAAVVLIFWLIVGWQPTTAFASQSFEQYQADVDVYRVYGETSNIFTTNANYLWIRAKEVPPKAYDSFKKIITGQLDVATGGIYSQNLEKQNINNWVVTVGNVRVFKSEEKSQAGDYAIIEGDFIGGFREEYQDLNYNKDIKFGCRIREKDLVGSPEDGTAQPEGIKLLNLLLEGQSGRTPVTCKTTNTFSGLTDKEVVEIFGDVDLLVMSTLDVDFADPTYKLTLDGSGTLVRKKAVPATSGPVAIAIDFGQTYPVAVIPDTDDKNIQRIIFTIEDHSIQQGRIQRINNVKVTLPPGLQLTPTKISEGNYCTYYAGDKEGFVSAQPSGNDWIIITSNIKPSEDYVTIKCFAKFIDVSSVLGGLSKVTKQIKAQASVNYEIIGAASVDVRKLPEGSTGTTGTATGDPNQAVTVITVTSAEQVENYLKGSTLEGQGSIFYTLGNNHGIDPAFAVAVAKKETSLGSAGYGTDPCYNYFNIAGSPASPACQASRFRDYSSPDEAIRAFYRLIENEYLPEQNTPALITCSSWTTQRTHCYCAPAECDEDQWARQVANYRAAVSGISSNWIWPLSTGTNCCNEIITAHNQVDNIHPDGHNGIDIVAPSGKEVRAVADGTVIYKCEGDCAGYGNTATIQHGSDYVRYSHFSSVRVNTGQNIKKGEVIGTVGSTGHSTGPHLDIKVYTSRPEEFEYRKDSIDPLTRYSPTYLTTTVALRWRYPDNQYVLASKQLVGLT